MHSNLAAAKQSIQAELEHARQGIAFYTERVEALETALTQLEQVDEELDSANQQPKQRQRRATSQATGRKESKAAKAKNASGRASSEKATAAQGGKRRGRKPNASRSNSEAEMLPKTGTDFWLEFVTDTPRTAVEIANAAVTNLKLKPYQRDQIQKLKQRVAPALASLVAAKKIEDSGMGRDRRYSRSGGEPVLH